MKLLHIDSSALGEASVTRELSAAIVAAWRQARPDLQVDYLDLDRDPLPHLTGATLARQDPEAAAREDALVRQFLDADVVVIGAPMYNFGIPSTLKAWIDRIAVRGKTFRYGPDGPEGLAGGRQVIVASARGSAFGEGHAADFQEPYLRQLFAFLGVDQVRFVRAEGVGLSPAHRASALAAARAGIQAPLRDAA